MLLLLVSGSVILFRRWEVEVVASEPTKRWWLDLQMLYRGMFSCYMFLSLDSFCWRKSGRCKLFEYVWNNNQTVWTKSDNKDLLAGDWKMLKDEIWLKGMVFLWCQIQTIIFSWCRQFLLFPWKTRCGQVSRDVSRYEDHDSMEKGPPPHMQPGQNKATSHDPGPKKVAEEDKSPYFREI